LSGGDISLLPKRFNALSDAIGTEDTNSPSYQSLVRLKTFVETYYNRESTNKMKKVTNGLVDALKGEQLQ